MDDIEIIKLFYERSEQGVVELSKKYGRLCREVASNILQDESDVEECVNDAFFSVWNLIPPEDPNPLRSYVCRIVRNTAANRYHLNMRQKRNSSYDIALHELDECIENGESVEKAMEERELSVSSDLAQYAARRMIKELPGVNVDTNDMTRLLEKYDIGVG